MAIKYTNNSGLVTAPMWENLANQLRADYLSGRGATDASVTQLIGNPLITALRDKHKDEIIVDITDTLAMSDGSVSHKAWENSAPEYWLTEYRFYREVNGWLISGQADIIIPTETEEDGTIVSCILGDYKKTSMTKLKKEVEDLPDFTAQLNMLNWLMQDPCLVEDGQGNKVDWTPPEVEKHLIVGYAKNFSLVSAARNSFPNQVIEIEMPIWKNKKMERYVNKRVKLHQDFRALESIPEDAECSKSERYGSDPIYAVMKEGRKSSLKNCSSQEEAEAYIEKHKDKKKLIVQFRPPIDLKCEFYCEVEKFCPYRNKKVELSLF